MVEKKLPKSAEVKRQYVEPDHDSLSVTRRCQLLGLARSSRHYVRLGESDESLAIMRAIDELYTMWTINGSQFTAAAFTSRAIGKGIAVSMGGRGRALDKVYGERLWRTVKYEEVYLRDYTDGWHAEQSLAAYFDYYCNERLHQALNYRTPAAVYAGG